jgi:hypothetical protein
MLEVMLPPFIEGCQEQHQFNWWLHCAAKAGLGVGYLPGAWNGWAFESARGAFYHIAGRNKGARLAQFRSNGRIPSAFLFMKTFDESKYPPGSDPNMELDDLHLHALHAACSIDIGRPGLDRVAVEIGAFRGRSTVALVEAIHKGLLGHLHVVETNPTPELQKVLELAPAGTVTLHTKPCWNTNLPRVDFCFIDGDHRWPALADTLCMLTLGAKVICMHDTKCWPKYENCWGSTMSANLLKQSDDRDYVEDAEDREGQLTFRGFLVSVAKGIDLMPVRECLRSVSLDSGELVGAL